MKTFEELTHEEILALTDEDIQRHIDLECASAGVPLLPPDPGPKPEKPEHEPDVPVFEAGGEVFLSQEDALAVAEAINRGNPVSWSYAAGYIQKKITGSKSDAEVVRPDRFFSVRLWDEIKSEMTSYQERLKAWEEANNEYQTATRVRSKATGWIWDKISEARETERQKEKFSSLLSRYVDLAEGDEATARKFLLQAHPEAEEFLAQVWTTAPVEDDPEED